MSAGYLAESCNKNIRQGLLIAIQAFFFRFFFFNGEFGLTRENRSLLQAL